ncbi:hypothetical protein AC579_2956 [Pseudocercospora musae]|uniref:Uncharacterized protein n=1 Tax=Pseudocercospora musae TaxID=113226 RepID=A0A139I636_9PEZI|nr:hypothetical protein AC579_2956 [Pseudocercospora musae]
MLSQPGLEHVFTLRNYFTRENIIHIGPIQGDNGPLRMCFPHDDGFLKSADGTEIAKVLPGSGDWALVDTSRGIVHLDVRLNLRTTTGGHSIFITYQGVGNRDEKSKDMLQFLPDAKSTEFGDHEYFASPAFETSDPDLKWVESSVFVGEGRWVCEEGRVAVEYRIWRVRPSK